MSFIKLMQVDTKVRQSHLMTEEQRNAPVNPGSLTEDDMIVKPIWLRREDIRAITPCNSLPIAQSALVTPLLGLLYVAEAPEEINLSLRKKHAF